MVTETGELSPLAPNPALPVRTTRLNEDQALSDSPVASSRGVTFRVVVLCLLLGVVFGYIIPIADYKFSNTFLGATHLSPGALGVVLILCLVVNPILGLLSRKGIHGLRFSRNEVLTVYLTCLFSCLVPGIGGNNYFVSFIIGSFYFATRENKWFDALKGLPPWFTPALNADGSYNRFVVEAWYTGLRSGQHIPWGAWIVPLVAWGALFLTTFFMMGCLSVMLRGQWGDNEALAFPLLRLPLELTEDLDRDDKYGILGRFFRSPAMWVGFSIAVFIQLLNGLHLYYPDWPSVPLEINTGPLFTEPPWNQIGWTPMRIWPIAIGVTYLLTSEISFSMWFFYWFMKVQLIVAYFLGFVPNSLPNAVESGQKMFQGYQDVGANLAFVAILFWTGHEHFGHIFKRAIGRAAARPKEKQEALPYPLAFWGFIGSFALLVIWGHCAGLTIGLAIALWVSYLVIAIVVSRVVAGAGLLFVHHASMPLGVISQLLGSGPGTWLSPANGIGAAAILETACIQDYRASLMPSFVQSFKLAHDRGINSRHLCALIFAVIVVTFIMGVQMNVRLGYDNGGLQLQGWLNKSGPQMAGGDAHALSEPVHDVMWSNWFWMAFGALVIYGITLARSRFLWFTLHPLGYLMCLTYPMHTLWFSMFIGWLCKVLITRFGGMDTYRKLTPAFLGLAFGDVSMMLFWLCIDGWQGRMGHQLMPG
ncbi:MAG: hypothetical protein JO316_14475 [Abitibacteriaceae bacterium]|nr:hypothetical protein [Abditibacteriaceae bacterium]